MNRAHLIIIVIFYSDVLIEIVTDPICGSVSAYPSGASEITTHLFWCVLLSV